MTHLVFCLRRLAHLGPQEFKRYWLDVHAPLVRRHAKTLGIRRYVQSHALDEAAVAHLRTERGSAEPFDGVARLWFDSPGEAAADPRVALAAQALLEDERRFIDLARSCLFMVDEHEIVPGDGQR
jgi:uncharacterized protein (TIGR02118 family)